MKVRIREMDFRYVSSADRRRSARNHFTQRSRLRVDALWPVERRNVACRTRFVDGGDGYFRLLGSINDRRFGAVASPHTRVAQATAPVTTVLR